MARAYGNDSDSSQSAREILAQEREHDLIVKKRIELGVFVGAICIAVLVPGIRIAKCVKWSNETAAYHAQAEEDNKTLEELKKQLQDPEAQNVQYEDPNIGNMSETGMEIANIQNQLIGTLSIQYSNNYQVQDASTEAATTEDSNHDNAGDQENGGGAVTLEPEDIAPSSDAQPASDAVENAETGMSADGSADGEYEYTPISDFNSSTEDAQTDATAGETNSPSVNMATTDTRNQAELVKTFKSKYFPKGIVNADSIPQCESTLWSWYGTWVFSATYDFSVNEVGGNMKGVWTCYDTSDTAHLKPLAIVTATYQTASGKFTNAVAIYTQNYVTYANGQSQAINNTAGNMFPTLPGDNSSSVSDGNAGSDGQGSENEYTQNITDDGDDDAVSQPVTITEDDGTTSTTDNGTTDTTPASNPDGVASWVPGSGANTTSSQSTSQGTTNSGAAGDGTWKPAN